MEQNKKFIDKETLKAISQIHESLEFLIGYLGNTQERTQDPTIEYSEVAYDND